MTSAGSGFTTEQEWVDAASEVMLIESCGHRIYGQCRECHARTLWSLIEPLVTRAQAVCCSPCTWPDTDCYVNGPRALDGDHESRTCYHPPGYFDDLDGDDG